MRITVEKGKRRLTLRQGRHVLHCCPCRLGFAPEGRKRSEGDGRTPEGRYFVCSANPQSKFYRALGISYPNAADARTALAVGRIDGEACRGIERAQRMRRRPAWDTPLGGWIMIHGEPSDGRDASGDWTAGCVAVSNGDMDVLFRCRGGRVAVVIRR